MTSGEHHDLMPAQEKLEWVTPKIYLMGAGDTRGGKNNQPPCQEGFYYANLTRCQADAAYGPS